MTINLSEVTFSYDFATIPLARNGTLILNKINESLSYEDDTVRIEGINLVVLTEDEEEILYPSVIGTSNEYFSLLTKHTEYMGKTLNSENIQYCTLEIADE